MKKVYLFIVIGISIFLLGMSVLLNQTKLEELNTETLVETESKQFMKAFEIDEKQYELVYFENIPDEFKREFPEKYSDLIKKFNEEFFLDTKISSTAILVNQDFNEILLIFQKDERLLQKSTLKIIGEEIYIEKETIEYNN